MTTNNIKAILFASLIVAMVLPFSSMSMAEAVVIKEKEHNLTYSPEDIGKFSDGTLDESKALDRIHYLRELCYINNECYEDEIDNINNEVKQIYHVEPKLREQMNQKIEAFQEYLENVIFRNLKAGEERMNAFPIVSIGMNSKSKLVQITLDSDYANNKNLGEYKKIIYGFFGSETPVKVRLSEGISIDSHTRNRETLTIRPLQGGASIGFDTASGNVSCTLGYLATDRNGNLGFVSAGHCPDNVGDKVKQPVNQSGNEIGKVTKRIYAVGTYCDCSFSILDDQNEYGSYVFFNSRYSLPVTGINAITSSDEGIAISMSGAFSGYRTGQIIDNSFDVYDNGVKIYNNVVVSQHISNQGDSGAPIMDGTKLTGIHVAHDKTNGDDYSVNISRTNAYLRVSPVLN